MAEITKNVLALDIANRTGWAHSKGTFGTWRIGHSKTLPVIRIATLLGYLDSIRDVFGVDVIVAEAVHVRFPSAAKPLLESRGAVMAWCNDNRVEFLGDFSATQIKKHATGSGKASKEDMVSAAVDIIDNPNISVSHIDDNAADAIALLDLYLTREGLAYA